MKLSSSAHMGRLGAFKPTGFSIGCVTSANTPRGSRLTPISYVAVIVGREEPRQAKDLRVKAAVNLQVLDDLQSP